jgi:uncharacterized repeat protein (TIGR01451 family)
MMHIDRPEQRGKRARLLGIAAAVPLLLVVAMLVSTGRATAAATDLGITKDDSPDPVVRGDNLTYTITVSNTAVAAADAAGVTVTDTLPSQVTFVSASTGCTRKGVVVTCDLGTLAADNTATLTIVVKAAQAGTISNTATVSHDAADANANNNTDSESTTVSNPPAAPNPTKPKKPKKKPKAPAASCAAPTIVGTPGDDAINGTSHADVIVTFTGNDQVFAGGGADLICADGGADFVFGDRGADILIGGSGPDRLIGAGGGDAIKGKNGRDRLKGGPGNDLLDGGKKRDRCKGGPGRNALVRCP